MWPENAPRTARAVLAVDMSDVEQRDFVPQVAVGLCRAAAAQSIVVATLTRAGQASAAAPNRRLVLESAIRLIWLSGLSKADRHTAATVMLEADRKETNDTLTYLEQQGQKAPFRPSRPHGPGPRSTSAHSVPHRRGDPTDLGERGPDARGRCTYH